MQLAVIPLLPNSKLPAIKDWPNQYKLVNADQLPKENVGIVTGTPSGLLVLDIDYKSGGLDTLKQLQAEGIDPLKESYAVKTDGGGYHIYYLIDPTDNFRNRTSFLPGMDIRANGGFVKVYNNFIEASNNDLDYIPAWLKEYLTVKPKTEQALSATTGVVISGGRNDYLTKVAGKLQRSNLLTLEGLEAINDRDCSPALDAKEVEIIFNSVSRYAPDELLTTTNNEQISNKSLEDVYKAIIGKKEGTQDGSVVKASDLSHAVTDYLADKEKVKGEATLISGLDLLLGGGHRLGEVTCWHAHAKTGKNTLWHKLMHLWLTRTDKKPIPIAYASRELTPESEVIPDLLSIHLQRNVRLLNEKEGEYENIIRNWPLYFASGYGHFSFDSIIKWVLECKSLGVQHFWFDHLHYMLEDPEDHKEASKLIKNIKSLAKLENINVQIIIQPNKLMDGQKLSLNSIKGGAAMGQAIDNLITLERIRCDTPNIMRLRTDAVRSKLARIGEIYLQYNPQTVDMVEVEEDLVRTEEAPVYGRD